MWGMSCLLLIAEVSLLLTAQSKLLMRRISPRNLWMVPSAQVTSLPSLWAQTQQKGLDKEQLPYCSFYSLLLIMPCYKPNLFPLVLTTDQSSWWMSTEASNELCVWVGGVKMQGSRRPTVRTRSMRAVQHPNLAAQKAVGWFPQCT